MSFMNIEQADRTRASEVPGEMVLVNGVFLRFAVPVPPAPLPIHLIGQIIAYINGARRTASVCSQITAQRNVWIRFHLSNLGDSFD